MKAPTRTLEPEWALIPSELVQLLVRCGLERHELRHQHQRLRVRPLSERRHVCGPSQCIHLPLRQRLAWFYVRSRAGPLLAPRGQLLAASDLYAHRSWHTQLYVLARLQHDQRRRDVHEHQ